MFMVLKEDAAELCPLESEKLIEDCALDFKVSYRLPHFSFIFQFSIVYICIHIYAIYMLYNCNVYLKFNGVEWEIA